MDFEAIIRRVAPARVAAGNANSVEEYVRVKMADRQTPGAPEYRRNADGTTYINVVSRLPDGSTLETFSDVSELSAEQDLLKDVLEATASGVAYFDEQHRLTRWNSHWLDTFRIPLAFAQRQPTFRECYQLAYDSVGGSESGAMDVDERVARHLQVLREPVPPLELDTPGGVRRRCESFRRARAALLLQQRISPR